MSTQGDAVSKIAAEYDVVGDLEARVDLLEVERIELQHQVDELQGQVDVLKRAQRIMAEQLSHETWKNEQMAMQVEKAQRYDITTTTNIPRVWNQ